MSGGLEVMALKEDDVTKMLAAGVHLGANNLGYQMEQYVFKRNPAGVYIIDLKKSWEKLLLAARAIAAIENPADVFVVSGRPFAQRAVIKFARYVGCTSIAGKFTPGAFTNQSQAAFREPRLLVVADPRTDNQPVVESSYGNIPVITFANTDSPLRFVDIAIPCNNKGSNSIGVMWWFLAREVLRIRGAITRETPWDVMPDLFFYRDPEKEQQEQSEALARDAMNNTQAPQVDNKVTDDWTQASEPTGTADWAADPTPGAGPGAGPVAPAADAQQPPAGGAAATATAGDASLATGETTSDWSRVQTDWAAEATAAPSSTWGATGNSAW